MNDFTARVPLVLRNRNGDAIRTVAAVPTKTPGLFVYWRHGNDPSYAISAASGLLVANGWRRLDDAVRAARALGPFTDWHLADHPSVMGLAFRTVHAIGETIADHGGTFQATIPGGVEAVRLRRAYDRIVELEGEIEDLESAPASSIEQAVRQHITDEVDAALRWALALPTAVTS